MGKLKLAVVGKTPYAERLAESIQKNAPEYLEVASCRQVENLTIFLDGAQPDILLCENAGEVQDDRLLGHTVKIGLSESRNEMADGEPVIFRYQKASEILRRIFQVYEQNSKNKLPFRRQTGGPEMTAVCAPGGHELQFPFSIAYAALNGEEGKALYLNLAEFSGMLPIFGEEEGENFSDLIYGIRQKKEKFPLYLESVLHRAETFDYVLQPGNPQDLYEMREEDLTCLFSMLREQTAYKLIVWNCGLLNPVAWQVMEDCDRIYCVTKESTFGKFRKMEFEQFLSRGQGQKLAEKVKYVSPHAAGGFVQGVDILTQLQSGEFVEQVKKLVQEG